MHNTQGPNCPNATTGPALDDHGVEGVGQSTEAFKIKSQVKLEAVDSSEEDEKQPLTMASNSIFETFSSYQSCFARGTLEGSWPPCQVPTNSKRKLCHLHYFT
ncbi:hypothetical protein SRHO_G00185680 [Serrasalmus rhombeus]